MQLDKYVIYADTDSLKLQENFDITVIENYNKNVIKKIEKVCKEMDLEIRRFMPTDIKGVEHCLGLFDNDGEYEEFITLGAKKYAYTKYKKNEKLKKTDNVIKKGKEKSLVLEITVSGIPKGRCKSNEKPKRV